MKLMMARLMPCLDNMIEKTGVSIYIGRYPFKPAALAIVSRQQRRCGVMNSRAGGTD
jgi:hypothetical protein